MAYIPPHKRNSNEARVLTPEKLPSWLSNSHNNRGSQNNQLVFAYAESAIKRWWTVGYEDHIQFPSSVNLVPISTETNEASIGERLVALMNHDLDNGNEVEWDLPKKPWVYMAENVLEDLLQSFENVKEKMKSTKLDYKPTLHFRVGKILFQRPRSVTLEFLEENLTTDMLKSWKKLFCTNIPVSYTEKIANDVPNNRFAFESEKELFYVTMADSTKPESLFNCRCIVKDGKLQLCKFEINPVRSMVVDMSVPVKNLDLRLILTMRRFLPSHIFQDDEMQSMKYLVDSAIIDPGVKGGLRWPLEKTSSGKYYVAGVWHINKKTYKNDPFRFYVRVSEYGFKTVGWKVFRETYLRFKRVESELKEEKQKIDVSLVSEMLKENLRFIWDNLLNLGNFSDVKIHAASNSIF